MHRLRIGVDARYAYRENRRGIGKLVYNLLLQLFVLDSSSEYFLYVDVQADPTVGPTVGGASVTLRRLKVSNPSLWEQWALPAAARRDKLDLLHCTSNHGPLFKPCPVVLSVMDVIEFHRRELASRLTLRHHLSRLSRIAMLPRVARAADALTTISQFSRDDIARTLRIPAGTVKVIYPAPDRSFIEPGARSGEHALQAPEVHRPYILCLGAMDPRKNTIAVVRAFAQARRHLGEDIRLVIPGIENVPRHPIRKLVHDLGLNGEVILLGYVYDDQLVALYRGAECFVYPSLYEGFGLPPLEAMALGTPVIASKATSIPEVVGDAALLFDPRSPKDLAKAMVRLLRDPDLRGELIHRGHHQAACFSWERAAQETLAVYQDVVARYRGG